MSSEYGSGVLPAQLKVVRQLSDNIPINRDLITSISLLLCYFRVFSFARTIKPCWHFLSVYGISCLDKTRPAFPPAEIQKVAPSKLRPEIPYQIPLFFLSQRSLASTMDSTPITPCTIPKSCERHFIFFKCRTSLSDNRDFFDSRSILPYSNAPHIVQALLKPATKAKSDSDAVSHFFSG